MAFSFSNSATLKSPVVKSIAATPNLLPDTLTATRKLFRPASSIRSSKCAPGLRICVTSRLTSCPGLAVSTWSQIATFRPAVSSFER